ncbi:MAG: hypothetical protein V1781_09755 [Bacteroidota bacterium]
MIRSLLFLAKLALYWLIFLTLNRIIFLITYSGNIPEGKFIEAILSFYYAIRLDASVIAYLIFFPMILWAVQQFVKKNFINHINYYYNLAMIVVLSLFLTINMIAYGKTGTHINLLTLEYITHPVEAFYLLTAWQNIEVFIIISLVIVSFTLFFRRMILMVIPFTTNPIVFKVIAIPIIVPFIFLILRGGIQQQPINKTFVYYSDVQFFNDAAVNPIWLLGHDVFSPKTVNDKP